MSDTSTIQRPGTANAPTAAPRHETAMINGSRRSHVGLNAANFFLAEVTGVTLPFVNDYLTDRGWSYAAIGVATSLAGLGVFLMQTPAGFITDRVRARRGLLAAASIVLGLCYGLLPLVPAGPWWIDALLFTSGMAQAFFLPLLGALALALVGHAALGRTIGVNQGWNHAGNLAAAVSAVGIVGLLGLNAVFYSVTVISVLAAASLFLIRPDELDEARASGRGREEPGTRFRDLLRDKRVKILFAATALFHLANAPVMPLVALDVKHLNGSHVQVALVVLVAQAVMIPVALLAGWACGRWGRKPVFAVGFAVLPVRIFLYSLATTPGMLVALQALDGIGAGIYGVVIVSMVADLTRGKGGFNALSGVIATALSVGGVVGPLTADLLVERLGFAAAFDVFAGVALAAAVLFIGFMPETRSADDAPRGPAATPVYD